MNIPRRLIISGARKDWAPLTSIRVLWCGLLVLGAGACAGPAAPDRVMRPGPLRVTATTGMIADAAQRIAGPLAQVDALMGPGIDPHLYKASEGDVRRLSSADLILYHGLHLEGRMTDVLGKLATQRPVLAVGETIPENERLGFAQAGLTWDPHLWFDVALWSRVLLPIAEKLAELLPEHRELLLDNARAYRDELLLLDRWAAERFAALAPERRVLVTAHDAFGYMGRRYGLEVVGIQGISTVSEAGLQDLDRVVGIVVDRRVPAIFVESSVSPRSIEALERACRERGHSVIIGGQLYSDAMGPAGGDAGTYPGMVRHNVSTITEKLR